MQGVRGVERVERSGNTHCHIATEIATLPHFSRYLYGARDDLRIGSLPTGKWSRGVFPRRDYPAGVDKEGLSPDHFFCPSVHPLRPPGLSPPVFFASPRKNTMSAIRKLLPLGNRVLVQRIVAQTQTASGIFLPETAQSRPNEGTVVAVGPGLRGDDGKFQALSVSEGDSVLLPEYGGTEVKVGDDTFHLFRDEDILGRFEG